MSIAQDLAFASAAGRHLSTLDQKEDSDGVLQRSLWGAAVVAYRRCFTTGKGHGLVRRSRLRIPEKIIGELSPTMREIHDVVLKEADQHVAHRVDDELGQMPIWFLFDVNELGDDRVAGVVALGATRIGPPPDQVGMFSELTDHLKGVIQDMATEKQNLILTKASALLAE
ncbi:MAG: hypothetical protein HKL85_13610 [Acidimicrobiaceae bacterium]|nr:hypothetical protein [Acidimicrobiaceae bacterium]